MSPSIKLTYFDIEGLAEQIRLAFALSGTEYEDSRVKFPDWPQLKPTMPYGVLPVLTVDGGPMHAQSGALLRWAGKEFSETLYPAEKLLEIEEAIGVVQDMQDSWAPAFVLPMRPARFGYAEDFQNTDEGKALVEKMRKDWISNELPRFAKYFTDLMDKNGGGLWLASPDGPTIADCKLIPALRVFTRGHLDHVPPQCLNEFPRLVEYIKRFCALDQVKGRYSDGIH
jgi:prostaglandin-H2 D-isomerase / glutathione transferase